MAKKASTSKTVSFDLAVVESSVVTPLMFSTTHGSHLYGESSILVGYQSLSGTHSGVASAPWSTCINSYGIQPGFSQMETQHSDPAHQYQFGQSSHQRLMYPLNTRLPPYGE